jgi:hypothetical protein
MKSTDDGLVRLIALFNATKVGSACCGRYKSSPSAPQRGGFLLLLDLPHPQRILGAYSRGRFGDQKDNHKDFGLTWNAALPGEVSGVAPRHDDIQEGCETGGCDGGQTSSLCCHGCSVATG